MSPLATSHHHSTAIKVTTSFPINTVCSRGVRGIPIPTNDLAKARTIPAKIMAAQCASLLRVGSGCSDS